jgi:hypothetical protein
MREEVDKAIEFATWLEPVDVAAIAHARKQADNYDVKNGSGPVAELLANALDALHLTPKSRKSRSEVKNDVGPSPLDELRERRTRRSTA